MPNAKTINTILKDCLFQDGEDHSNAVIAKGITLNFGFHPKRLESHRSEVITELNDLPTEFHVDGGGGWSFLNMCNDKAGELWTGEHRIMEQLVCLGIALKLVKEQMPDMRDVLPGGVPYYVVDLRDFRHRG